MRIISVRVPDEIWEKLSNMENRGEVVRKILAQHLEVELKEPKWKSEIPKMIREEVARQLAWLKLK